MTKAELASKIVEILADAPDEFVGGTIDAAIPCQYHNHITHMWNMVDQHQNQQEDFQKN